MLPYWKLQTDLRPRVFVLSPYMPGFWRLCKNSPMVSDILERDLVCVWTEILRKVQNSRCSWLPCPPRNDSLADRNPKPSMAYAFQLWEIWHNYSFILEKYCKKFVNGRRPSIFAAWSFRLKFTISESITKDINHCQRTRLFLRRREEWGVWSVNHVVNRRSRLRLDAESCSLLCFQQKIFKAPHY